MQQPEIKTLTSLRFFASAAIVVAHAIGPFFGAAEAGRTLAIGVSFFFVLSGFILTYSSQGGLEPHRFYLGRVARLWPVHLVTLVLAATLLESARASGLPAISNVLLLQAWIPVVGFVFSLNAVSWSISDEVFFYLLFPLLRAKWLWKITALAAVFTAGSLLSLDYLAPPVNPPWPSPPLGSFWSLHMIQFPALRLLEFCIGVALGKLFLSRKANLGTVSECLAVAAILGFGLLSDPLRVAFSSIGFSHVGMWLSQTGGMLIFAAAIYVFAHEGGAISRVLQTPTLVLLGNISFCTYMFHQIGLRVLLEHGWIELGTTRGLAVYIVVAYSGSYLLWQYVEKPGRRLIFSLPSARRLIPYSSRQ